VYCTAEIANIGYIEQLDEENVEKKDTQSLRHAPVVNCRLILCDDGLDRYTEQLMIIRGRAERRTADIFITPLDAGGFAPNSLPLLARRLGMTASLR
jgi:hypothetical protein